MGFSDDRELIESTQQLVLHQLSNFWTNLDEEPIRLCVKPALEKIEACFNASRSKYVRKDGNVVFSPFYSVGWAMFLYRLSRELVNFGGGMASKEADSVYYLNKIMNNVEWYHAIELPVYMMGEHMTGSVMGRAQFGEYFFVFQGTNVGGNGRWENGKIPCPKIGKYCVMYPNSTVLGKSVVGDNVMISAGTYIKDEVIPDNCIVFGRTPNLTIKLRSEEEMRDRIGNLWIL